MTKNRLQSSSENSFFFERSPQSNLIKTIQNINKSLSQSPILSIIFLSTYIFFLLILPLTALVLILFTNNFNEILKRAFDPIAISAYILTLKMAFFAAFLNTIFGFLITWVIIRYKFFGKKYLDAAVDLPFALPTSVAGLTLTTV